MPHVLGQSWIVCHYFVDQSLLDVSSFYFQEKEPCIFLSDEFLIRRARLIAYLRDRDVSQLQNAHRCQDLSAFSLMEGTIFKWLVLE